MRKLITTLGVGVILMIPSSPAAASEAVERIGTEDCYVEYDPPRPPSVSTEFPFVVLTPGGPPSAHVYCPILDEDPAS